MKTVKDFCEANNLHLEVVSYRHQFGKCKRKGFDIVRMDGQVVAEFEPYDNSGGEKWYIRYVTNKYEGQRYVKRITKKLLAQLPLYFEKSAFINTKIAAQNKYSIVEWGAKGA